MSECGVPLDCDCCLSAGGSAFVHFHEQCEHTDCPNSDEDWA